MEYFNFNLKIGGLVIPVSLFSLGRSYVKSIWKSESYSGYKISSKYMLGNASSTITPKDFNVIKKVGGLYYRTTLQIIKEVEMNVLCLE